MASSSSAGEDAHQVVENPNRESIDSRSQVDSPGVHYATSPSSYYDDEEPPRPVHEIILDKTQSQRSQSSKDHNEIPRISSQQEPEETNNSRSSLQDDSNEEQDSQRITRTLDFMRPLAQAHLFPPSTRAHMGEGELTLEVIKLSDDARLEDEMRYLGSSSQQPSSENPDLISPRTPSPLNRNGRSLSWIRTPDRFYEGGQRQGESSSIPIVGELRRPPQDSNGKRQSGIHAPLRESTRQDESSASVVAAALKKRKFYHVCIYFSIAILSAGVGAMICALVERSKRKS